MNRLVRTLSRRFVVILAPWPPCASPDRGPTAPLRTPFCTPAFFTLGGGRVLGHWVALAVHQLVGERAARLSLGQSAGEPDPPATLQPHDAIG